MLFLIFKLLVTLVTFMIWHMVITEMLTEAEKKKRQQQERQELLNKKVEEAIAARVATKIDAVYTPRDVNAADVLTYQKPDFIKALEKRNYYTICFDL